MAVAHTGVLSERPAACEDGRLELAGRPESDGRGRGGLSLGDARLGPGNGAAGLDHDGGVVRGCRAVVCERPVLLPPVRTHLCGCDLTLSSLAAVLASRERKQPEVVSEISS